MTADAAVLPPLADGCARETAERWHGDLYIPMSRRLASISDRERHVLAYISVGLSNEEVGLRLGVSPFTIKSMLPRIAAKMGVPNDRAGMVAVALRTGLID